MGLVHIPRTFAAAIKGGIQRYRCPLSDDAKSLVGIGLNNPPHIYSARAGIFDVDVMFHMNNASYLNHAELARWQWSSYRGTLFDSFRASTYFIVSGYMVRFRREIPPLKRFDIETRLGAIDDRNLWVYQTFHHNGSGKVMCQILTKAVMVKEGKVLNPRTWAEDNIPAAAKDDIIDDLVLASNNIESIFDEKATQFTNLEEVMRRSANNHDDKVS